MNSIHRNSFSLPAASNDYRKRCIMRYTTPAGVGHSIHHWAFYTPANPPGLSAEAVIRHIEKQSEYPFVLRS